MELTPAILESLKARAQEPSEKYYIECVESEIQDLAAGIVPRVVQAMATTLLEEWDEVCRRNAARPTRKARKS